MCGISERTIDEFRFVTSTAGDVPRYVGSYFVRSLLRRDDIVVNYPRRLCAAVRELFDSAQKDS